MKRTTWELKVQGSEIVSLTPYDKDFVTLAKQYYGRFRKVPEPQWFWEKKQVGNALRVKQAFEDKWSYVDPELYKLQERYCKNKQPILARKPSPSISTPQVEEPKADANWSITYKELLAAAKMDEPLPNGWLLKDYQKEGVKWLLAHVRGAAYTGAILGDDMGLGKTLQALVAAKAAAKVLKCSVIVVAPPSLLSNWQREASYIKLDIDTYSWGKLPKDVDYPYLIIWDEAHYAKSGTETKRGRGYLQLSTSTNCYGNWSLTGTPLVNGRPIELFPLLKACKLPITANKRVYEERYCAAHLKTIKMRTGQIRRFWENKGISNSQELHERIKPVFLRRMKTDKLNLPKMSIFIEEVSLEKKELKEYDLEVKAVIQEFYRKIKEEELDKGAINALAMVQIGAVRRIGERFKLSWVQEKIDSLLDAGEKVVVFGEYRESLIRLNELYKSYKPQLLLGDTPKAKRQTLVDNFQKGDAQLFLTISKAGGVGITLTESSTVIQITRPWSPGDCSQCIDRCNRIGQTKPVFAFWPQLPVDREFDRILDVKQGNIANVLEGGGSKKGSVTVAELAASYFRDHSE